MTLKFEKKILILNSGEIFGVLPKRFDLLFNFYVFTKVCTLTHGKSNYFTNKCKSVSRQNTHFYRVLIHLQGFI